MLDVLLNHVPDVPFPEEDHAIEALSLGILYPGFCVGIQIWRLLGHLKTSHTHATERTLKFLRKERIPIMYEHPFTLEESVVVVGQVAGLLQHPWFSRCMMDAYNLYPSRGQFDYEEDKEPCQARTRPCFQGEKITGCDTLPVRAEEVLP